MSNVIAFTLRKWHKSCYVQRVQYGITEQKGGSSMNKKVVIGLGAVAIIAIVWNYMNLTLVDVSEEMEIPLQHKQAIAVETTNADIEVVATDQHNITVAVTGQVSPKYKEMTKLHVRKSEDTIELTYKPSNHISIFAWSRAKNVKMTVYVPNKITNITLKTSSGDQVIKEIRTAQSIIANATSGDIKANYIHAMKMEMVATSGDIIAKNITSEQHKMITTSGDVTLHNSEAQTITLHATSGDITANALKAAQLEVETTSGEQTFREIATTNATMIATSGDIVIDFIKWDGTIKAHTTSGEQNIQVPKENRDFTIKANVTSGDIVIDVGDIKQEFSKATTINMGKGTQQIQTEATNGDIVIRQSS